MKSPPKKPDTRTSNKINGTKSLTSGERGVAIKPLFSYSRSLCNPTPKQLSQPTLQPPNSLTPEPSPAFKPQSLEIKG